MATIPGTAGDDRLFGTDAGNDILYGLGGNDLLRGRGGADHLDGGDGDDNLYGGLGADTLIGGAGIDTLNYGDSAVGVIVNLTTNLNHGGTAEGDIILDSFEIVRGSLFGDILIGDGNGNTLRGLAGDDILYGLGADDLLDGGDGADFLDGGDGHDVLRGGAGGDSFLGGAGLDLVSYAYSDAGVTVDLAAGTGHGGIAEGDRFLDAIERLDGSLFADSLTGGAGDETFNGLDGDDILAGMGGADTLQGFAGDDTLSGGDGDDLLQGGEGADALSGGSGFDAADYIASHAGVTIDLNASLQHGGAAEGDTIAGDIEFIRGSKHGDSLTGDGNANTLWGVDGADRLNGGDGDDILTGGPGADIIDGGAGIDTVSYADSIGGPTINLTTGINTNGDGEGDTLIGIEIIEGSRLYGARVTGDGNVNIFHGLGSLNSFNGMGGDDIATGADYFDIFYGGEGNDVLDGASYSDQLMGDAGDDTLIGGTGNDDLYGDDLYDGTGADRFVYTSLADTTVTSNANARERILDFSHAEGDVVDLGAIDADGEAANGDTAFTLVAGAFTGAGAELLITPVGTGRSALVRADVDGDTRTDFLVQIFVDAPLTAADFVL